MEMMIGTSLGCFKGLTLEPALELCLKLARDFNIRAVEVRFEKEAGRPSQWYWEDNDIRDFLKNFQVKGAHLPFLYLNPISPNPGIREASISQLKMAIARAAEMGMDYAVMHASGQAFGLNHEEELTLWLEVIAMLAGHAGANGIVLTLENADALADLKDLATVIRKVDSRHLKLNLDIGHAYIRRLPPLATYPVTEFALRALDTAGMPFIIKKGMPYKSYGSISSFIISEFDLISCVHVHDYNGRRDHLGIGDGRIDFSCLSTLSSRGFTGPVILEAGLENHYWDFAANYRRLEKLLTGGETR